MFSFFFHSHEKKKKKKKNPFEVLNTHIPLSSLDKDAIKTPLSLFLIDLTFPAFTFIVKAADLWTLLFNYSLNTKFRNQKHNKILLIIFFFFFFFFFFF